MIYVTGDLHGDPARLSDKALRRLKKGDTLLVCGDFGFVWDGSPAELKLRRKIGKQKYITIFVDGTHDNLPMISPLGAFLDRVEQEMQFGSWYFGRLHKDKKIPPRQQAVFREVVPAEQR